MNWEIDHHWSIKTSLTPHLGPLEGPILGPKSGTSGQAHFDPPGRGGQKRAKTVPTGRVIKYPNKCALFCPPGGPGGAPPGKSAPRGYPPWTPLSSTNSIYISPKRALFWGPKKGPSGGAKKCPPGGPPRGGPGGPILGVPRGVHFGAHFGPCLDPLALLSSYGPSLIGWSAVATHHRVAACWMSPMT